jgi:hypothetical protein
LKLSTDDWRVKRYAVLMVAYDGYQARLAAGANISMDGLAKLDSLMQEIRSSLPPEPITVSVQLVEGCVGIYVCQHCHQRNEISGGMYTPPSPKRPPAQIDGEVLKPAPVAEVKEAKALPAPQPKPLRDKDGYVPAQDFHKGAPLQTNNYSGIDPYAGASGVALNRAGVPDVSRHHALTDWPVIDVK